jgi:regulator of protease activity HflC (stomatin/prohibitin superfamily)
MSIYLWILVALFILFLCFLRQVNQYERGVMFTMGRYSGTKNPGWRLVIPIFQGMRKVDMRLKAVDVPNQEAITKDNVSCQINAVIYYKVIDASKAIIGVENFYYAVSQLAQTTMRNVVGSVTLDELLSQRDAVSDKIEAIVDGASENWGINAESVDLKDIVLPESMKRTMAKQAEAEREKRAVIINSEGEVLAAENISKAAQMLAASPGALHLRTLNSINDISSDQSNTVVFAVPLEVLRAFEGLTKKLEK